MRDIHAASDKICVRISKGPVLLAPCGVSGLCVAADSNRPAERFVRTRQHSDVLVARMSSPVHVSPTTKYVLTHSTSLARTRRSLPLVLSRVLCPKVLWPLRWSASFISQVKTLFVIKTTTHCLFLSYKSVFANNAGRTDARRRSITMLSWPSVGRLANIRQDLFYFLIIFYLQTFNFTLIII